ncbi:MAG: tyrosine-type recombinase/integrase [Chloroflexi bacterium]|nr:tyrosine-type recombinase/integrase [Chloroflexota bacterium]
MYYAGMDVPHYWTADQVQRLLDALASNNRHQARTAALIMWRTGLRVSEVLELEWRDLDYSGEPATLIVRRSKTRKPRTVRMHGELVQLFTNWPSNRTARDKVVPLAMRTVLRHIADAVVASGLAEESPGTGKRLPGAHSLRHSAARHWLMVGRVPLNVVSSWLGHANVQVTLRIYLPIVGSDYGMENVP